MDATNAQKTQENPTEMVKQVLFENLLGHYKAYSDAVNKLPVKYYLKQIILKHVDDSWLWAKESFLTIDFAPKAEPELKVIGIEDVPEKDNIHPAI